MHAFSILNLYAKTVFKKLEKNRMFCMFCPKMKFVLLPCSIISLCKYKVIHEKGYLFKGISTLDSYSLASDISDSRRGMAFSSAVEIFTELPFSFYKRQCDSGKIHYPTRESNVKFRGYSFFHAKFNAEFPLQIIGFPIEYYLIYFFVFNARSALIIILINTVK